MKLHYFCNMIYPSDFEFKIGFIEVRNLLKSLCLSSLGKEEVDNISFTNNFDLLVLWLKQIGEFKAIQESQEDIPVQYYYDMRVMLTRLKIENSYPDEQELFHLQRSLHTIINLVSFLSQVEGEGVLSQNNITQQHLTEKESSHVLCYKYPTLEILTHDICTFPHIVKKIEEIINKFGNIKDTASPALARIRGELNKAEGSVSRTLYSILRNIQQEGLIEKDTTPTLRDGRLVIPAPPGMKKRIRGIVHDESATGKTIFIEPAEVVEANNRIRELEAEEKREVIRILTEMGDIIRPEILSILESYTLLAKVDFIRAKALLAKMFRAIEPTIKNKPHINWVQATHPLLQLSLEKQSKKVVPLDITLTTEKHMLIISGPNAGGKSVCLKTIGLLQYMLQCGLSVPMLENSSAGIFQNIMIDIGDGQSIENDLSTYSGHLLNMKNMIKQSNEQTLLLIDEFGTGTEPQIGGAIAQAVLTQFVSKKAFGIITTHYQNLKHFAEHHTGVINGAMLYDRKEMKALFQLSIGQPGSSFAIEIARKIGLPEVVITEASELVGSDYIQSDKYLQDIVRDKRYWENKRQNIHKREKEIEKIISQYQNEMEELQKSKKDILRKAKEQAENLLKESNKFIENTIKEIKEAQAEKEETKRIREGFNTFKNEIRNIDEQENDDKIARKIAQIKQRKERHAKRQAEKQQLQEAAATTLRNATVKSKHIEKPFVQGDTVRIKGLNTIGKIEQLSDNGAVIIFGDMRTKLPLNRLEHVQNTQNLSTPTYKIAKETRKTIDSHKENFRQDIDLRGLRGDEALNRVMHFIDDAILVGVPRVRILHGTGNGILRSLIRQYLNTVPNVASFKDEHVQFGGAGITVVDID